MGQRNFARTVLAISSAVLACCAVVVSIKVMATDAIAVEQPRVPNRTRWSGRWPRRSAAGSRNPFP
ncbi:hypothetical protein ACFVDQ_36445 [Streptomyces sp. NPDC057684]|uniref:hypothetical protein n=1 Tax=Streptomyces sp. NPDC057684 TaxID=3346211 RepID=UPI0036B7DE76